MRIKKIAVLAALVVAAASGEAVFNAGFAKCDITPEGSMPMWGYSKFDRRDNMSAGVNDQLYARALVLDTGETKLALVGMDTGRAPHEPMVDRLRESLKADPGVDFFLFCGSHTHHGPALELARMPGKDQSDMDDTWVYYSRLEQDLKQVVREAAAAAQPARWGWASMDSAVNRNRHTDEPPVPVDRELFVLRLETFNGDPICHLINFAGHPTNHLPQDNRFGADYIGFMADIVKEKLDSEILFLQGAAGDLQCDMDDSQWKKAGFDEEIGERLAVEVLKLAPSIKTHRPEEPYIRGHDATFDFELRIDLTNPVLMKQLSAAFEPEFAASYSEKYAGNRMHPRLTTVIINGELALAGASGEFFCDHAIRLKNAFETPEVIFAGYCNGHDLYFPTERAYEQEGYGANNASAWVEKGGPEKMIDAAIAHIGRLAGMEAAKP
jgi:neutral ceramidase